MQDLHELAEYVLAHPTEHEQRWRLAKKLYMAWEYGDALKHLQILKRDWSRKLNVLRYLAATYYRLGRYEESIAELKEILHQWPAEQSVWEQLARVYEVASRPTEAADAWGQIVKLNPQHPIAAKAVHRLRASPEDTPRGTLRLMDSDSGIHLSPSLICRNCGAHNSAEFDRCWQCHASLAATQPGAEAAPEAAPVRAPSWLRTLLGGAATVATLSAASYVTLEHVQRARVMVVPLTVDDALDVAQFSTRLIVGGILAVVWPVVLWVSAKICRAEPPPFSAACGAGLLLAGLAFLCMWAPVATLLYTPVVPVAASLAVVPALLREPVARLFAAWTVQAFLALVVGIGAFVGLESWPAVAELPEMAAYEMRHAQMPNPGEYELFAGAPPTRRNIVWGSTGSEWLDERASNVVISAKPNREMPYFSIEVREGEQSLAYAATPPFELLCSVTPGSRYTIVVTGEQSAQFTVTALGLLAPAIEP